MASIYANAELNLAATASYNSDQGCIVDSSLARQHRISIYDHQIDTCDDDVDAGVSGNFLSESPESGNGRLKTATLAMPRHLKKNIHAALKISPLSKRGWVLQESLLSRRIVHFTASQLLWECSECFESEDGVLSGRPETGFTDGRICEGRDDQIRWWDTVEDYSNREFTFIKDRLAAMGGMIQEHKQRSMDTPLLGLWLRYFFLDLAWSYDATSERYGSEIKSTRITELDTVPSWSWLSITSGVKRPGVYSVGCHNPDRYSKHLAVQRWNIRWSGAPYASPLLHGEVIVTNHMAKVPKASSVCRGLNTLNPWFLAEHNGASMSFFMDRRLTKEEWMDLYLLLLFIGKAQRCLAVLPVPGCTTTYRRVGVAAFGVIDTHAFSMLDKPKRTITLV